MVAPRSPGLSRVVSAELVVARLQRQLREKDLKLTDIQLEALTSAHQLDNLRDAVNRMQVSYYTIMYGLVLRCQKTFLTFFK